VKSGQGIVAGTRGFYAFPSRLSIGFLLSPLAGFVFVFSFYSIYPAAEVVGTVGNSVRNDRQPHERWMCSVMQNSLPDHDVACVAFVIAAGVQIAVLFRKSCGGDDGAQTMAGGDHSGCEPQVDVVLVDTPWLEERGAITKSGPKPSRKRALMTPSWMRSARPSG
jgi:hypothetical protein